MSIIQYGEPLNVLLAVKGHPFERDAFYAIFEAMEGVSAAMVDQPAAAQLMTPEGLAPYDALVLYDMPGLDFRAAEPPAYVPPPPGFQAGLTAALAAGKGVVALHHAIAGWPAWEGYAELLGGRFLYKPGRLRGRDVPDSGYRHDVTHTISVVGEHPVTAGLPASFTITDELYLSEVFEDDVVPLLRSDYAFVRDNFYSATLAVNGTMFSNAGWEHAPGSNLVGWAKRAGGAPLVYLQPGDGPATYADPTYRTLIENAIRWVASDAARAWARGAA